MQQLDDDIDDLFRDAASHYPLKIEGQNWNAIMGRVQTNTPVPDQPAGKTESKYVKLLGFLILSPLFFMAHLIKLNNNSLTIPADTQTASHNKIAVTAQNVTQQPEAKHAGRETTNHIIVSQAPAVANPQTRPAAAGLNTHGKLALPRAVDNADNMNRSLGADNYSTAGSTGNATILPEHQENQADSQPALHQQLPVLPADSTAQPIIKKEKRFANKGWYAGILLSPDLSTVKWQQTGKIGYGAGFIVGYRISKRVAVETGLLWDRKYYYSKGEYFDTKKIPGASNWNITEVNGWCRMWEIPVQVRYFFATGNKTNWYLNGGLSSYIMNKESYDYSYLRNNNTVIANRAYDNATRNWFSVAHAGIGYEKSLGTFGQLRIEPYLKIPLGGLGIGSLPVTSMGLNIGITKSFR